MGVHFRPFIQYVKGVEAAGDRKYTSWPLPFSFNRSLVSRLNFGIPAWESNLIFIISFPVLQIVFFFYLPILIELRNGLPLLYYLDLLIDT